MWSFISISFCTLYIVTSLPVQNRLTCSPEITLARPDPNYDSTQLIGQWFILARTRGPWQGHNWAGSVTNFRLNGEDIEGKYSLFVTGNRFRGCIEGMHAILRHTNVHGRYTAMLAALTPISGNYTVYHLSRDYVITYECYKAAADSCSRKGRVVAIMGRRPQAIPEWLMQKARQLVCEDERIDIVNHDDDCSDKVQWPRARRDITDAVGALDRMNLSKLKKRSIHSAQKRSPGDLGPADTEDEECSLIPCSLPCQYGYLIDENGCQICQCLDGPKTCPSKDCQPCKYGYRLDERGCETCQCRHCVEPVCEQKCVHGFVVDEEDCKTCNCRAKPYCPLSTLQLVLECDSVCEYGRLKDEDGCETCSCECPARVCDLDCNEYATDSSGCQVCKCRVNAEKSGDNSAEYNNTLGSGDLEDTWSFSSESDESPAEFSGDVEAQPEEARLCPELKCQSQCLQDSERDKDGCPTCRCVSGCPKLDCTYIIRCDFGSLRDERGCETCACEVGEDIRGYEGGDEKLARTVIGVIPRERRNFAGEMSLMDITANNTSNAKTSSPIAILPEQELTFTCPAVTCIYACSREKHILDENGCATCTCIDELDKSEDSDDILECPAINCTNPCGTARSFDDEGCMTCHCAEETLDGVSGESMEVLDSETVDEYTSTETRNVVEYSADSKTDLKSEHLETERLESTDQPQTEDFEQDIPDPKTQFETENLVLTTEPKTEMVDNSYAVLKTEFEIENFETELVAVTDGRETGTVVENLADSQTEFGVEKFESERLKSTDKRKRVTVLSGISVKAEKEAEQKSSCDEPECWDGQCEHGSKLDRTGCQTCECLRPKRPIMACPFLACPDGHCWQGWWPDRNGCASCKCKRHELECPIRKCERDCMSGYRIDENGCDTCECIEGDVLISCPEVECDLACDTYREDENGCEECSCTCEPMINCTKKCENGFVVNSQGCPACTCQSDLVYDIPESESLLTELVGEPLLIADDFDQSLAMNDGGCVEPTTCWDGPCVYGSVPNLSDCNTCTCISSAAQKCDNLDCAEECKYGSYFDRYGCETCRCKPNPIHHCPDLSTCALRCANGYRENSRGCEICECFVLVPPQNPCQKLTCDSPCPTYKSDRNGCRTCECGCTEPICWDGACRYGSKPDDNGCKTCACERPDSPEISCGLLDCRGRECANGYRIDRRGCHTCECIDGDENLAIDSIPKQRDNCTEDISFCPFACLYGHVELNNCLTCECKNAFLPDAKPCPLLDCGYCEFGYIEDPSGCNTCQCKAQVAANLKCTQDCSSVCHYNYVATKNDSGCLRCQCIDPPKPPVSESKTPNEITPLNTV